MLERMKWAQGYMVAAVGTVRCGCKSSCKNQSAFWSAKLELGVNNYSHKLLLLVQVLGSLAKLQMVWSPLPIPTDQNMNYLEGMEGCTAAGLSQLFHRLCFTRMYIQSSLHPFKQLHDSFLHSGHHKCWLPQEIPISSPPEILQSGSEVTACCFCISVVRDCSCAESCSGKILIATGIFTHSPGI